jgi:hypothetical protein
MEHQHFYRTLGWWGLCHSAVVEESEDVLKADIVWKGGDNAAWHVGLER